MKAILLDYYKEQLEVLEINMRKEVREASVGNGHTIIERTTLKAAESMMRNYKDATTALADLADNGFDNRIPGEILIMRIRTGRGEIAIWNSGGEGLTREGLDNFFNWGHSEKGSSQIGQYGVGGKAAIGFLGKRMEIRCSPKGGKEEYRVVDPNWREKGEAVTKTHNVSVSPALLDEGYFEVKIGDLERTPNPNAIIARLGEIYRPLLADNQVIITVNQKRVEPLEIKYLKDDPKFEKKSGFIETGYGDKIPFEIGVLEEGQKIKPGIRCYYKGRLIGSPTLFDNPHLARMPQASRLAGEIHLDFLSVTMNKADFIQDERYDEVVRAINRVLSSWAEKLKNLTVKSSLVDRYEEDLAKQAKLAVERILAVQAIVDKELLTLGTGVEADTKGTKIGPGGTGGEPQGEGEGGHGFGRRRQGGKESGEGKTLKRLGVYSEWKPVAMGSQDIRAQIVSLESGEVLLINTDFPMYQAAKRSGDLGLFLYHAETSVMEFCRKLYGDLSPSQYLEKVNAIMKQIGIVAETQLTLQPKGKFKSRGSIQFQPSDS